MAKFLQYLQSIENFYRNYYKPYRNGKYGSCQGILGLRRYKMLQMVILKLHDTITGREERLLYGMEYDDDLFNLIGL